MVYVDSFFYITKKKNIYYFSKYKLNFPKMLIMLAREKDKDAIFVILQKHLLYEEIKKQKR